MEMIDFVCKKCNTQQTITGDHSNSIVCVKCKTVFDKENLIIRKDTEREVE